jgi:hypothetical protein
MKGKKDDVMDESRDDRCTSIFMFHAMSAMFPHQQNDSFYNNKKQGRSQKLVLDIT